jgi:DNA polymerase-3 subunit gamma/tau
MSESPPAYRVLARKYRPQRFAELIGQEAMVQTLGNAIKRDRIAHAFLMTGVRGVGKTSTARLIAKALNCDQGPTIDPCGVCEPCVAIAEGRHIDVVEMDAASNTGVDDVREIIEAVRYASVSARYKVYIIDEVHMLTKNAFNALLKTLEEPPEHVKFIFATTEIGKVPVTVLSRCQRFDLRRVPADTLVRHFEGIAAAEQVHVEPEALVLIARAAEGSVRDGLSILDQAIAHAGTSDSLGDQIEITANQVREMLGLADRGAVRRLFQLLLAADPVPVLASLKAQNELGVEPATILRGLMDACHGITLVKVGGPPDPAQAADERAAQADLATRLPFATLHRLWQLLLKGHDEVIRAADPSEALDMAMLRLVYASSLPDPGELASKLAAGPGAGDRTPVMGDGSSSASLDAPSTNHATLASLQNHESLPGDFPTLVALLESSGKRQLGLLLTDAVGLVDYSPPTLAIFPLRPLPGDLTRDLAATLKSVTGLVWNVTLSDVPGAPSLREQEEARARDHEAAIWANPIIAAAKRAFPEAELVAEQRSG